MHMHGLKDSRQVSRLTDRLTNSPHTERLKLLLCEWYVSGDITSYNRQAHPVGVQVAVQSTAEGLTCYDKGCWRCIPAPPCAGSSTA